MSTQSNNVSGMAAGLVPKSVLSDEIDKDPSTSYESPNKQQNPPNKREAPGAPVREARVAKRKNEYDLHLDPYENSPTCSRTLFPPN